jgi:Tetracyclin repressor-like, C-terminal domain
MKPSLRAAVTHKAAAASLQAIFPGQLSPAIAALGDDSATAGTRVGLIASQTLGLPLGRYVLRLPPGVAMDLAQVLRWLGPAFQRHLTGTR